MIITSISIAPILLPSLYLYNAISKLTSIEERKMFYEKKYFQPAKYIYSYIMEMFRMGTAW